MTRRSRSSDALKSSGSVIRQLLGDLGIDSKIEQHRVWAVWQQAVGEQIARFAAPAKIRDNVLEIKVANAVWMQQLQLLKPRLLRQLNEHLGDNPLRDIYLRRGQVQAAAPPAPPRAALPQLDDDELAAIATATATINDAAVRTAMQRLLQRQRQLDKQREAK